MHSFLSVGHERRWKSLTSLFVDDVLAPARSSDGLQRLIHVAHHWAEESIMNWNMTKSCGTSRSGPLTINTEQLPDRTEATYLGMTLSMKWILDPNLLVRLSMARGVLFNLKRRRAGGRTWVGQRRFMIKTFTIPSSDYFLLIKPLTEEVELKANELDAR